MADPAPKQTPAQIAAANAAAEKASAALESTYGKLPAAASTGGRPASSLAPPPVVSDTPAPGQSYSVAQLEKLWTDNGGPPAWASTMAAIAYYAESGGNPNSTNPSGATGLWQIEVPGSSDGQTAEQMKNPVLNVKQAIKLLGNGSGISHWGTGSNGADTIAVAAQNQGGPLTAQQLAPYETGSAASGSGTDATSTPKVQGPSFLPPQPNVDITNFHGYDLSSFVGGNELGNAEHAIEEFSNPSAKDAQGMNLQQRIQADYGYTVGWALQHPDVGAVLIWAAAYADPSTAAGKAAGLSQLQKTQWYQTTDANKRAFEAGQSTDSAETAQAVKDAVDKVEATANQIGVTLTPKQAQAIGKAYAEQSYTPQGALGTSSGTSQEQLDQMVISAVTTVQKTGALPGVDTTATFNAGAEPATSPTGTGIASQLFESLKGIAQQYMMYSSSPSSPITDADLNKYVASYLQQYTGTGSYGSSNLMNGANQSFTEQMQTMASQMYPTLAPVIKMGTAPATYTAPIQNLITNTMGLTQGSVDLTSPQWNWAIKADPTTGATLSQDQILQKLTAMPAYQQTANAKNTAHTVINGMASMFGTGGV